MNKKRGFTLVELLAVVAILAVIVIIALPNVMGMFRNAKKNSFETEVKNLYKTAQQTWMSESLFSTGEQVYSRCNGCSGKSLDLTGRKELEYYIRLNKSGNVVEFYATDGTYQFSHNGDLLLTNIQGIEEVSDLEDTEVISINEIVNNNTNCEFKLVADGPGSFSPNEELKEICLNSSNDGYTYTSYSAIVSGNKYNNNYFQVLHISGEPTANTYIRVYSDSTKSNLLAEFNSNDIRDYNRYSLNNFANYHYAKTDVKRIGDYTRTDYYVETSDDVCYGYDCGKPVSYGYGYSSFINDVTYTGPWITDQETLNKIRYFEQSLSGTVYELHGFSRCKPRFVADSEYHNESECTGDTYYIKYNDTSVR